MSGCEKQQPAMSETGIPSDRPCQDQGKVYSSTKRMSTKTFPVSQYASLLPKLAAVLEIVQNAEGILTPSTKQALFQAVRSSALHDSLSKIGPFLTFTQIQTNDFKSSMARAREFALALPGGELGIEEQDQIIEMLEKLRDRKQSVSLSPNVDSTFYSEAFFRQQLALFSSRAVTSVNGNNSKNVIPAEIDSVASTPL
jgi:hypothetical protein